MMSETAKNFLHRHQPGGPEGAPWLGAARGPRRGPLAIARAKFFWLAQTIQSQIIQIKKGKSKFSAWSFRQIVTHTDNKPVSPHLFQANKILVCVLGIQSH